MAVITYKDFKKMFDMLPYHSELEFYFLDKEASYMLIKHEDAVSFQRCGYDAEEIEYSCFEEIYLALVIDGVSLKDIWDEIEIIIVNSSFRVPQDIDDLYFTYGKDLW